MNKELDLQFEPKDSIIHIVSLICHEQSTNTIPAFFSLPASDTMPTLPSAPKAMSINLKFYFNSTSYASKVFLKVLNSLNNCCYWCDIVSVIVTTLNKIGHSIMLISCVHMTKALFGLRLTWLPWIST